MASDDNVRESALCKRLAAQYIEQEIDTSLYPELSRDMVNQIQEEGRRVCVIHDRLNDWVHSYSVILYQYGRSDEFYLIFVGGIGGSDTYGVGPIRN